MLEYHCNKCGYISTDKDSFHKKSSSSSFITSYVWRCPECSNTGEPKTVSFDIYRCPECGYTSETKGDFQKKSNVSSGIIATNWGCPECEYTGEPKFIDGRSIESNPIYIKKYDSILARISSLPAFEKFLGFNEIKELPNILADGEEVEKLASGYYKTGYGIIVATSKRIIFIDKGMLYGLRVEDFSYNKITSIEYSTGLLRGAITILASGNKAVIDRVQKELVKDFSDYVRSKITSAKTVQQTASGESTDKKIPKRSEDFLTQLERLANLKEKGVLTEEEFNEQKKKILGS